MSKNRVYRDPRDNCLKYGHAPPTVEAPKFRGNQTERRSGGSGFVTSRQYQKLLNEAKKLKVQLKTQDYKNPSEYGRKSSASGDRTGKSIRDEDVILNIDRRTVKKLMPIRK